LPGCLNEVTAYFSNIGQNYSACLTKIRGDRAFAEELGRSGKGQLANHV
jgi:hypothetical protein